MAKIHELKTLPKYFNSIKKGLKTFEIRNNDRGFKVGDHVRLRKIVDGTVNNERIDAKIIYILDDFDGLSPNYVGLQLIDIEHYILPRAPKKNIAKKRYHLTLTEVVGKKVEVIGVDLDEAYEQYDQGGGKVLSKDILSVELLKSEERNSDNEDCHDNTDLIRLLKIATRKES